MASLDQYRRKRDFTRTPEPMGDVRSNTEPGGAFVVQKHEARRLHFDLRLELDGVLASWAVPKGPSLEPGERRLAVRVEDHPLEYGEFEGVIPEGEYGGGTVMLWDRGRWWPTGTVSDDRIDFELEGTRLRGAWTLVRTSERGSGAERGRGGAGDGDHGARSAGGDGASGRHEDWLLIKRRGGPGTATPGAEPGPDDRSVATGRTMAQIARERDAVWSAGDAGSATGPERPDPAQVRGARAADGVPDVTPQLATLVDAAPSGDRWIHEIKLDGYRIVARVDAGRVQLKSRNGKDWTDRFPEIATILAGAGLARAVLDGEVVAYLSDGSTSFGRLQEALSGGATEALVYQVFDVMYLRGFDLRAAPLEARKTALSEELRAAGLTASSTVRYTDHIPGRGPEFLERACGLGLEGVVSKRGDSRYRSGRNRDWLKSKCTRHAELVVGGFTDPGGAREGFGALLLGRWSSTGELRYAGKVGTGFSDRLLGRLHARLKDLEVDTPPFRPPPPERGVHWVRPELVAEVEFTEWTRDGSLRHPVFRGLREDKDPNEIRMDDAPPPERQGGGKAAPRPANDEAEVAGVRLSNPDRVLYPGQGVTKLALARYYEQIAEWVLPWVAERPLSLVRCPQGHERECFFQKHPSEGMFDRVARVEIREKEATEPYLYVRTLPDLVALVQGGVLELHVWGSRVDDVERPDLLVFDLDPGPGVPWSEMLRVAKDVRSRLEEAGLAAFARTTGGKGLHVVVPLERSADWEVAKAFARAFATAHAHGDRRVTATMAKAKRHGKIFLDYLRNGRGATAIASYSTRAREGATVAVPVRWDELGGALRADRYRIDNVRRRLASLKGDPWEGFEDARSPLDRAALRAVGLDEGGASS